MNIPYGVANFQFLRNQKCHYVDKTQYIPNLEAVEQGRFYLLFLRPRRFGKSLWISVLEHYYDLQRREEFEGLFEGLYIAQNPTPERSRYLIFRLEFTGIDPNQDLEGIQGEVLQRLSLAVEGFCHRYRGLLPTLEELVSRIASFTTPALLMSGLLSVVEQSEYQVYVLVDEYDNFTNALISLGKNALYLSITHESGFLREFYKALKEGTSRGSIARIFITGVSPVTMDDVTSGANIFKQVSLAPDLNAMTGFTHAETRGMLETHMRDRGMTLKPDAVMEELTRLYNGYRFSPGVEERVFNPDMVLHYLSDLRPPSRGPAQLIDHNVRIDLSRLRSLMFEEGRPRASAVQVIEQLVETQSLAAQVRPTFPLEQIFKSENFPSLLYYLGMLSLGTESEDAYELIVPNYVAKTLYWEALHTLLYEEANLEKTPRLESELLKMAASGDMEGFLSYIFPQLVQMCSNRDLIQLSEKNIKFMVLPFIMLSNVYLPWSELELNHGYSDLLLIPVQPQNTVHVSFMLELKYVKLTQETSRIDKEGVRHTTVKALTREARQKAVAQAFEEGDAQLARYEADPRLMALGRKKGWRSFTLVFEGLESLHWRAPGGQKRKLLAPKQG